MLKQFNEPIEDILKQYDIKVLGIRTESYKEKKGVWWIQTQHGYKILKKVSCSEETLRHLQHAVKHLNKNGIDIPAIVKTSSGGDYAKSGDTCYVLSEAIQGKNPDYGVPVQLETVVRQLARFHKASEGFVPLKESKPKIHLGMWIEDYTKEITDLENFYQTEEAKRDRNAIGDLVVSEFPEFCKRAKSALKGLDGKEYHTWVQLMQKKGCLCHQDFAAGNLILTPDHRMFVIDTDSLTIDLPARDIRKLLNKIMKKSGKWDLGLLRRIISFYQAENPLTPEQWHVVKLDLTYPHLFTGAMSKYYFNREKEWTVENYLKRIKEMTAFEKTITPILNAWDTLI